MVTRLTATEAMSRKPAYFGAGTEGAGLIGIVNYSKVTRAEKRFLWWGNSPRGIYAIQDFCDCLLIEAGTEARIGPAIISVESSPKKGVKVFKTSGSRRYFGIYIESGRREGFSLAGLSKNLGWLVEPLVNGKQ